MLDANLMASAQSGNSVQPGTSLIVDSSADIYYVAQDQTIHEMWWGGTKMLDANLMASSQSGSVVEASTGMLHRTIRSTRCGGAVPRCWTQI